MVSNTLVILQPVLYDAWCTLCLSSAVISLWMIGPAMDEMLAAPWVLGYDETLPIVNDMLVGASVLGFSFVKGKIESSFGGGWKEAC